MIETAVSGKTAVLGKVYTLIKNFGWAKARRQAPPLPHCSYATVDGHRFLVSTAARVCCLLLYNIKNCSMLQSSSSRMRC